MASHTSAGYSIMGIENDTVLYSIIRALTVLWKWEIKFIVRKVNEHDWMFDFEPEY